MIYYPRILAAGDSALIVEFGNEISPEINGKIRAFSHLLKEKELEGIRDIVPTFRSVMINYDPMHLLYGELVETVKILLEETGQAEACASRIFRIPVCYGGDFGPDLEDVAAYADLTVEETITLHSSEPYLIYMLGFLPGFAYLGGMDEVIAMPRLDEPRVRIEAGSVGIGGESTGIYPTASPAGWRLLGRTPVKTYDADREIPILYEAGDYIQFVPITEEEYRDIEIRIEQGTYEFDIVESE